MSNAIDKLPPEMQARLANILAQQQQAGNAPAAPTQPAPQPAPQPIVKPPSLMDHVIALRQEVAALRQEVSANSNVVEAVGQATGQLYQMFQPSAQSNAQGATFSQGFQETPVDQDADY